MSPRYPVAEGSPRTVRRTQPEVMLTGRWQALFQVDLARTVGVHRRGTGDPAFRVEPSGAVWRTSRTPHGPATMRIMAGPPADAGDGGATAGDGTTVLTWAWGPGAAWVLASLPALLGADDDRTGFQPAHPLLAEMDRRYPHLRIGRSGRVFEALVPAVLEQKVVGAEARRAWRTLMLRYGEPPPGPAPRGMRVFPPPRTWARIPSWAWHRAGVEGVRGRTVIGAAHVAERLRTQGVLRGRKLLVTPLPPLAYGTPPAPPMAHGGRLRLLSFGRLLPYKGLDLLAETASEIWG